MTGINSSTDHGCGFWFSLWSWGIMCMQHVVVLVWWFLVMPNERLHIIRSWWFLFLWSYCSAAVLKQFKSVVALEQAVTSWRFLCDVASFGCRGCKMMVPMIWHNNFIGVRSSSYSRYLSSCQCPSLPQNWGTRSTRLCHFFFKYPPH